MDLLYRPATPNDAGYFGKLDLHARKEGWIWGQDEAEHRAQLDAGALDYVVAQDDGGMPVAYALLAGFRPGAIIVELRRVVVERPNQGIGRTFMLWLIGRAFEEFGAHRVWLDTFEHNKRGQHLYESLGFVREGILRDGFPLGDRYVSLYVYGLLRDKWAADDG